MQVLGELIKLPQSSDLPLPWWHRSPLGLLHTTPVHAALVRGPKRRIPEIIVSVLDPYKWKETLSVSCRHPDESGVILKAISTDPLKKLNIALAESATIEYGSTHTITLVCEPPAHPQVRTPGPVQVEKALRGKRFKLSGTPQYFPAANIITAEPVVVKNGWVTDFDWRKMFAQMADLDPKVLDKYDMTRAVVSADTDTRILRYVFPLKQAKTLRIVHADKPQVLLQLMRVLKRNQLNVMSALLRRGGAPRSMAVLVAVCEPPPTARPAKDWVTRVKADVDKLRSEIKAKVTATDGCGGATTTFVSSPRTVVARMPDDLNERVDKIQSRFKAHYAENAPARDENGATLKPLKVFVSRRFVHDAYNVSIVRKVRRALRDHGAYPLEANDTPSLLSGYMIHREVSAHMWAADAAVVILSSVPGVRDQIGQNIPHELGFMMGQAKPVFVLAEEGFFPWANMDGVYFPRFSPADLSTNRKDPRSIHQLIARFLVSVRQLHARLEVEP